MSQTFSLISVSSIFIGFLVLNSLYGANGNIIRDVCKNAVTSDPDLKYGFCVASLSENPKSKDADLLGIGEISLQICLQNVTSIESYLDKIAFGVGKGKQNPKQYYPLNTCLGMYGSAIRFINMAITNFKEKDYYAADKVLSAASGAPTECEHRYKQSGLDSPFTKENSDFFQLTRTSLAITNMVK
ncbi:putative invertase inhibitor [Papaver somniferum]|uniref:putative invertase inhibitor n=1 Tax=Papaver somniferum TaxID=3469 RepID=UPI000E7003B5|nr:putative invertase inhibitor [Papaver somniferum]